MRIQFDNAKKLWNQKLQRYWSRSIT